jgi:ABC-type amino acid transport substrate-binding protein
VIASGDWQGQWDIAIASLVPFDQPADPSERRLFFSHPYAYMPMGVLSLASVSNITALGDLSGRRVGVLEHSAYERLLAAEGLTLTSRQQPLLSQVPPDAQLVALANLQKAIRQLDQPDAEAGVRVDAIFGPGPMFQEAVKSELPVKWIKVGVQPLAIAAVPPENLQVDRLILEINTILARLQRQGTLSEIYLRWYEQDFSQPEEGR